MATAQINMLVKLTNMQTAPTGLIAALAQKQVPVKIPRTQLVRARRDQTLDRENGSAGSTTSAPELPECGDA